MAPGRKPRRATCGPGASIGHASRARRWGLVGAALAASCLAWASPPAVGLELELADINGKNGFVLHGVAAGDNSGLAVSAAGDVNGDGIDDLIIGAPRADPNGLGSGASYVVFGGAAVGSGGALELSALDGSNGFVLNGRAAEDFAGNAVSAAGDVNGDGIGDLIIGAPNVETIGVYAGASYVVFGGAGVGSSGVVELSALDGGNGFVLNGVAANDFSGGSVGAAGDVNGDGVGDLLIGATGADPNGSNSGAGYVVFGGTGVGSSGAVELSALDGSNGFVLNGVALGDNSGKSVSTAGDVNGDGVDDVLIGAWYADPNGNESGGGYVVFGGAGVGNGGVVELSALDGSNGFVLNGAAAYNFSGASVSTAGDVNGDGVDDLIIGAVEADPNGFESGASYVVFGGAGVGNGGVVELSALDGGNGFVLNGGASGDFSGSSVSAAGDVNGDGVGDLFIGATGADPNGSSSGADYVVFGGTGVGSSGVVELSALDGNNGFVLNGGAPEDAAGQHGLGFPGSSVSAAGDVNADGVVDLIIGAGMADPNGSRSGAGYIVFGERRGPGMSLTGLFGAFGYCQNGVTGEQLGFPVGGNPHLDCDWKGVAADTGEQMDVFMRGRANGDGAIGGNAFGFDSGPLTVFCRNVGSGQILPIQLTGGTSWDCEAAGLAANPGDFIDIIARGTAR